MRINLLNSFAAGILIATTITGIVYFSSKNENTKAAVQSTELTVKEMKNKLETEGYVVQTIEEYEASTKEEKTSESKETPAKETVTQIVVNVSEGMTSIDVGNVLVQAKMVENAFAFSKDIESRGLQNRLKPGTYVVSSDMSYDQVISTIFK
nr:aminodeoxychorismate lyase [Neobacillus sp. Marseille-Q6967]